MHREITNKYKSRLTLVCINNFDTKVKETQDAFFGYAGYIWSEVSKTTQIYLLEVTEIRVEFKSLSMSTFLLITRWNIVNRESFCQPSRDGNSSFSSMDVASCLAGIIFLKSRIPCRKSIILVQVLLGYINVQIYIAMRYNFPSISNAAVVVICLNIVNGNVVYAQTWEVLALNYLNY